MDEQAGASGERARVRGGEQVGAGEMDAEAMRVPTLGLLHFVSVLNGLGTLLLGPILPLLAARWQLSDAQSGLLLMSQFCGSFLGGVSTSGRLRRGMLQGLGAAAAGLLIFAWARTLGWGCAGLVLGGFGVGRAITTVNIVAGRRAGGDARRGSALSRINLSWSVGALLSPLLAAWLTPHFSLPRLLSILPCLFGGSAVMLLGQGAGLRRRGARRLEVEEPGGLGGGEEEGRDGPRRFTRRLYGYFFVLLFLYGGLETCLSGWLTTFAVRYGRESIVLSEYTMVLLLSGLTVGRAGAAWLLLRMRDRTLVRIALALSAGIAAGLAGAHGTGAIAGLAILLGVTLAPIFPGTFAMLLGHHPPARKAGIALAASGLGAAGLPWLMGEISTRVGSLQVALAVPVGAALMMLGLSLLSGGSWYAGGREGGSAGGGGSGEKESFRT